MRNRIKELRYVRAGSLRENERNWRRHPDFQRSALEAVLAEVGVADALIAYERGDDLVLIDGHLRKDLGDDVEWPVLVLDVDDAEADKLLATLDPLTGLAEADADVLEALLATVETEDVALTKMLEELAENAGIVPELAPAPEAQMDRAAELQEKWQTATGQVWGMGAYTVCPKCGKVHNLD